MNKAQLIILLKGMAMGAADIVPGVSGGTIAFITGIYERLITAISRINFHAIQLLRRDGFGAMWRYVDGSFLLTLFSGILISVLTLARVLKWLLENQPILIWSFFFGLVLASVIVLARNVEKWRISMLFVAAFGALLAYVITIAPILYSQPSAWFLFFAGALAICAMILPGISGAFILLLLGAYEPIINAVHDLNLRLIAIVGAGAIVGLLSFSHLLKWLFARYHNLTIALLTGFIFGSLNKIWPWKAPTESLKGITTNVLPSQYLGDAQLPLALLMMIVGFGLIVAVEYLGLGSRSRQSK